RIQSDREHRALAGLSMGGSHTYQIGFRHLELFSHLAMLSGGIGGGGGANRAPREFAAQYPELAKNPTELNSKLKLFWFGTGEMDNPDRVRRVDEELTKLGIHHVAHVSKYDHSFRTWRRDIYYEVAPRLFRN
ncbi:MAG TPA: esterase, partial [Acidobacteriota bacterium]|nr:esterase [Acidobacteriota bacterium]